VRRAGERQAHAHPCERRSQHHFAGSFAGSETVRT
jgi:hypothetical protein